MKVLNFGSLNIDYVYSLDHFVQKGETIASDELHIFSGGKGLNQSVALGRAGVETYHAGAIGPDGEFLLEILREAGVRTELVKCCTEIRTGNAIIQKDKSGDNCIILYGGANRAMTREQVDETLAQFAAGDFLVLQNEINEVDYIMEKAHEKGMRVVLNPSPMDERIFAMPLSLVDYFLLNEVEAGQLLHLPHAEETDGKELAERLSERFPDAVIVLTLGSRGSVCLCDGALTEQGIYRVETVDTTAAGDTFTGYFLAGIMKGFPIAEAMDLAARAAAIAVSGAGAAPSIPDMERVRTFVFPES